MVLMTRRRHIKYLVWAAGALLMPTISLPKFSHAAKLKEEEEYSNKEIMLANSFLDVLKLKSFDQIKSIKIPYYIYIGGDVDFRIIAEMFLEKEKDTYKSVLNVGGLKPGGVLDGFKLVLGYLVRDQRVLNLYKNIETRFTEEGVIKNNKFISKRLEQKVEDKTSIIIEFDRDGNVRLLKREEREPEGKIYPGIHNFPLGEFWNYVLTDSYSAELKKYVVNPFEGKLKLETAIINCNKIPHNSNSCNQYNNSLSFEGGRFSLIGGTPIFKTLTFGDEINSELNPKIPFDIFIPEIINNKTKEVTARDVNVHLGKPELN